MRFQDILLALLTIVIWGGNVVAIKIGVTELPPMVMITLRFAVTALVFLPFMRWPGREKFWKLFEISMYMGVVHQGLLFTAMGQLPASTMSVLLQSQVLFTSILGILILKERMRKRTILGLSIGFAGILLTLGGPDVSQNPFGVVITLTSTLALAFSYIRMRQIKDVHAPTFIALMNGIAVPFVAVFSLIFAPHGWATLPDANWITVTGVLIYQALLVSLSHILWQALLSRNEVTKVTAFILLMPVVAILLSALVLGETIHSTLVIGGGLTLVGVGIVTVRRKQRQKAIELDPVT